MCWRVVPVVSGRTGPTILLVLGSCCETYCPLLWSSGRHLGCRVLLAAVVVRGRGHKDVIVVLWAAHECLHSWRECCQSVQLCLECAGADRERAAGTL